MATIKNLFVAWLGDFEVDAKAAGLEITEVNHECGGYDITLTGPDKKLRDFIRDEYCAGMDEEDAQEIISSIK